MAQKKTDLCERVSRVLVEIADGRRKDSSFPRDVSAHLKRCKDCGRKQKAVVRVIADWTRSAPINLSEPRNDLAYHLANRIVRAVCCYAQRSPDGVKRRGLYHVHEAILQILNVGASRVLARIPAVLEEVAQDRAHYFVQ